MKTGRHTNTDGEQSLSGLFYFAGHTAPPVQSTQHWPSVLAGPYKLRSQ